MDITSNQLKTMKVKQLRRLIREAIEQVLNEDEAKTKQLSLQAANLEKQAADIETKIAAEKTKDAQQKIQATTNENLNEMAMGNKLSDENMDLSPFANQMLSGKSLKDILTYIKENPGATEKQIADAFNFTRQQPVNALISVLRKKMIPKLDKDGNPVKDENGNIIQVPIVTRLDKSGEVIVPKAPGEEDDDEEPVTGVDALFVGKGDSLAQFFDNKPNADGSEDFTPETEPELSKVAEPVRPVGAKAKAAEFTTDDSNDKLISKIIKLQGASKLRVKEATGDEGGLSSADVTAAEKKRKETATATLPELINQLADRIKAEDKDVQEAILNILATKFASVGYASLTKKVAQAVGTSTKVVEPKIDDLEIEDSEDTDELDEAYEMRKLQFYAGIIK